MKKSLKVLSLCTALATILPINVFASMTEKVEHQVQTEATAPAGEFKADEILVKFKHTLQPIKTEQIHSTLGAEEVEQLGNGKSEWQLVKVPDGQAEEFRQKYLADPNVDSVEFNLMYHVDYTPNDPLLNKQWHHKNINSYGAWDVIKGSQKKVAILDTGVQLNHPDLQASLLPGKSFVSGASTPNDDHGHGTHCAGLAAAIGDNGIGVSGVDGSAKIIPVKVLNAQGSGYTADIINGITWATDNGADIISMSLGGGAYQQSFQDAINYAWGKNKIIVAAAGNSGSSSFSYPAAYNNVLAVAATDSNDGLAYFSNYGSWVDIAAPGVDIYSTYKNSGYTNMSGTSMATPIAVSVLALTWGKEPGATNQQIVDRVLSTADQTPATGTSYQNGRVNAFKAVNGF
ncbi:peptidase S8 [Brevibacterium sp. JNUCC-42]|nr:peptidase S8 [Brevibacterium sp. JNUCC-42]